MEHCFLIHWPGRYAYTGPFKTREEAIAALSDFVSSHDLPVSSPDFTPERIGRLAFKYGKYEGPHFSASLSEFGPYLNGVQS
jgi:hypothetical protein